MEFKLFGKKFKFVGFGSIFNPKATTSEEDSPLMSDDYSGIKLRLFTSKSNKYIGQYFPRSGYCVKKIQVENDPNWYVFKLNEILPISGYDQQFFIIKPKNRTQGFNEDKIEVYFMFVKRIDKLRQGAILMKDLRYTGNVYSRPIIQ